MLSEMRRRPIVGNNGGSFGDEKDVEFLRPHEGDELDKELNLYRSGSAPPTVEGSLSAVGGLFGPVGGGGGGGNAFSGFSENNRNENGFLSEEDYRSDPSYLSFYYSKVNTNPRLPPPLLSKEDWRTTQRLKDTGPSFGGIGDRRNVNRLNENSGTGGRSLFSMPPGFNSRKDGGEIKQGNFGGDAAEWAGAGDGLIGLGLGTNQKSLAEIFQNDLGLAPTPLSNYPSRPTSRNALDVNIENLDREMTGLDSLRSTSNSRGPSSVQSIGPPATYTYAAAVGGSSLSRSTTPDPHLIARVPSPSITPVGGNKKLTTEKRGINRPSSYTGAHLNMNESADLVSALSGMSLSTKRMPSQIELDVDNIQNNLFNLHGGQNQNHFNQPSHLKESAKLPYSDPINSNDYWLDQSNSPYSNSHNQQNDGFNSSYQNYGLSGYAMNPPVVNNNLPPLLETFAAASAMAASGMNPRFFGGNFASNSTKLNKMDNALQSPFVDPSYLQYSRANEYGNNPHMDLVGLQNAYLGSLMSPQKFQYGGGSNHQGYYGNPIVRNETSTHFSRNLATAYMGPYNLDVGCYNMEGSFLPSLLEEFKSNKAKCFELSEISKHVVEFSTDQYGSRFIQQKLETATVEEKNMVYQEIFPVAFSLMTNVFGNYVIQKIFEYGMDNQRRELASMLYGNLLDLSLEMYGCRVIQKAIEVVDIDQKIMMVQELEGHIMKCVHDQNGNHVIQKCIECVPEDSIQFIVSTFFDQVVTLSTHPYGCRVIQRVLEHCKDPETQRKVMEEVLGSVSMLAQDQYGNYVVQHVLEHGKSHERSFIIKELAGKIVHMSQQKFASNVVEKCLTFGGPIERKLLVVEMLGTTDENEPLQAMMKDQFGNYVVQKVLETCDDQQREFIMARIKIHLNALKKYTYGKHIVGRVEKLLTAGERKNASLRPALAA